MPKIIKKRGAEKTRTVNGLWENSTKMEIRHAAMRCTFNQLIGQDTVIIQNIAGHMKPSRRLDTIKEQTEWFLEIANDVRNTKIANLEQSLLEDEEIQIEPSPQAQADDVISIASSGDSIEEVLPSPESIHDSPAQSPGIPGFEPSEPSSQSTLPSLPSRARSSSSESFNNPHEAAEIFGFEPQQPIQAAENQMEVIDELDAMEALDAADANIGQGIENRFLAEDDLNEILENMQQME